MNYTGPVQQPEHRISVAEYLALEERSEIKHEYHDGVLVATSGARRVHNRIKGILEAALRQHLASRPYEAYSSDMKVHVVATNRFFYPDVVVDCSNAPRDDDLYTDQAPLIIEVLSESTSAYDRGEKFAHYRELPSLEEYVLVDGVGRPGLGRRRALRRV